MNKGKLPRFIALSIISFWFIQDVNAQGANTYQFTALAGTYTNMAAGTAFTAVEGDDVCPAATVPLGFTFNFCGEDYTTVRAGSNGYLTFTTGWGQTATNSVAGLATIKPGLMWLWDDIDGGTGTATYATTGTAPDRVFTFQFKNWEWNWNAAGPNISIQVKLYETTNIIEYIYKQETQAGNPTGSGGATIGIVDDQTTSTYLSLNNATAAPSASSTTLTSNIGAKPANGQIYRFKPTPPIDVQMDSVITLENFCSNASAPVSVAVSNKGTATINDILINWTVDGVAQAPVAYTAPAPITNFTTAPNNTAIVSLGDVFFADNTPKVIKAWVVQANGLPDAVNTNDTVTDSKAANLTGVILSINPQNAVICEESEITLDAGMHPKNPVYIWANGHITQTIQVSTPGSYNVKVQNTDGCFDRDTVVVAAYPSPEVNSIAIIDNTGGSYTFNAVGVQNVTSYIWDFGDGQTLPGTGIPGQVNHQYNIAGDYTVSLTVRNNQDCGDVTVTKVIHSDGIPTGMNDLDILQNVISIYPNPSWAWVTIANNSGIKIKSIAVLNIAGQQVFRSDNINATKFRFNSAGLVSGIYNVVINSERGRLIKKLEVIR
ncbi:T9SS type A sorting domain-containing protein [Taibaiella lutea]|uniref:T9SS type A sorting domain-containing protein n=1 Tax=Taibaiella lutea TaxID=2608001 RepID=A0A5M6CR64_9BACT|nr:PKD domain-containing protein [Taibaiella lutea]KAA5537456.1 T9SS type A sorting domain-containing protein [Taibaiella lutea]